MLLVAQHCGSILFNLFVYIWLPLKSVFGSGGCNISALVNVTLKICEWPVEIWAELAIYCYLYGLLLGLEAAERIHEVYHNFQASGSNLECVLPRVVGSDNCAQYDIFITSALVSSQTNRIVDENYKLQATLRDFIGVDQYHFVLHQLFFEPVSFFIVSTAVCYPIILVFNEMRQGVRLLNIASTIIQSIFLLTPILLTVVIKFRKKYLLDREHCQIFKIRESKLKRRLVKYVLLARVNYGDE